MDCPDSGDNSKTVGAVVGGQGVSSGGEVSLVAHQKCLHNMFYMKFWPQ